jgi:hypothetical protein
MLKDGDPISVTQRSEVLSHTVSFPLLVSTQLLQKD